jgi:hypothetical protein
MFFSPILRKWTYLLTFNSHFICHSIRQTYTNTKLRTLYSLQLRVTKFQAITHIIVQRVNNLKQLVRKFSGQQNWHWSPETDRAKTFGRSIHALSLCIQDSATHTRYLSSEFLRTSTPRTYSWRLYTTRLQKQHRYLYRLRGGGV